MNDITERSFWLIVGSLAIAIGISSATPTLEASLGAVLVGNVCLARVWLPGLQVVRQRHSEQQSTGRL
jgi:hypothetical protein